MGTVGRTERSGPLLLRFPDAAGAAEALAVAVAARLQAGIGERGAASLVVPGGSTPGPIFDRLARSDLDWSRVTVTLCDERWVGPDKDGSNERLARRRLLVGRAAAACFVGLKTSHDTPQAGLAEASRRVASLPRPFDVLLLGMGEDGHVASLFPGSPALKASMDGDGAALQAVEAPGARGAAARITLAPPTLLDSRFVALLIAGEAKLRTLARARAGADAMEMPVRAILQGADPQIYSFP